VKRSTASAMRVAIANTRQSPINGVSAKAKAVVHRILNGIQPNRLHLGSDLGADFNSYSTTAGLALAITTRGTSRDIKSVSRATAKTVQKVP